MPSGRRSSVAEHWRLKPEALGSIPGGATFPFKPMPFKGLQTVRPRLCLGSDTISIGLQTTEESVHRTPPQLGRDILHVATSLYDPL